MTEIEAALNILRKAMKEDYDYAWSWHCNVAVMMQDAEASHRISNDGAARFMKLAFGVDTSNWEARTGELNSET